MYSYSLLECEKTRWKRVGSSGKQAVRNTAKVAPQSGYDIGLYCQQTLCLLDSKPQT